MKTNKTFGSCGGVNTPFHQVHAVMSGEIVNELGSPICTCDISDIPIASQRANREIIMRCLNSHDALVAALKTVAALEESTKDKGLLDVSSVALQDAYTEVRAALVKAGAR